MKATKANLVKIVNGLKAKYPYINFAVRATRVGSKVMAIPYDCGVEWCGVDFRVEDVKGLISKSGEANYVIFANRHDGEEVLRGVECETILLTAVGGNFVKLEAFEPYPEVLPANRRLF